MMRKLTEKKVVKGIAYSS